MEQPEQMQLPAQQQSAQLSALDHSLLTELGAVAMESKIQTWNPQENIDTRALVGGFNDNH